MGKILSGCLLLTFCAFTSSVIAQESIGFTNPQNIELLLDYRLPDWGYSNFWLDFDHRSSFSDQKYSSTDESSFYKHGISLNPRYNLHRESEARILNIVGAANLNYERSNSKVNSFENSENPRNHIVTSINSDLSIREYLSDKLFLLGAGDVSVNYLRGHNKDTDNGEVLTEKTRHRRDLRANPEIGFGFGRIRNVTPVIRAVRLDERLRSLSQSSKLEGDRILDAADQLTRYQGYLNRYDRPEKHFWEDMNRATNSSFSGVSPYDMMYLTDVLDETIGSRLEGWEILAGATFNYRNTLERIEEITSAQPNSTVDRSLDIDKSINAFIRGQWYQNLSLNHQIGFFGNINRTYPLDDGDADSIELKWSTLLSGGVHWLWNVADRLLITSTLSNRYSRVKRLFDTVGASSKEIAHWNNRISLNGEVTYFIENRLAVAASLTPQLTYWGNNENGANLDYRDFESAFSVGARYYFSRNLY